MTLSKIVLNALHNLKASDIFVLDVKNLTSITDEMIICSGRSTRHVNSIANEVIVNAKKNHYEPLGIEGKQQGEWISVDLGYIVVHIMLPSVREFYNLEELWQHAN